MSFATDFAGDIDAAVVRLERAGGLPSLHAPEDAPELVTAELVKRYQRRAADLRAEALNRSLNRLFAAFARVIRLSPRERASSPQQYRSTPTHCAAE